MKRLVSMLCLISVLAVTCMCNVIAASSSFELSLTGLTPSDYNAESYTAINDVVSLKVKGNVEEYVAKDGVKTNKNLVSVIKITPVEAGKFTILFETNGLALNTKEDRNDATKISTSESPYSFDVTESDVQAGTSWYVMGDASNPSKITQISFTSAGESNETPEPPKANITAAVSEAIVSGDEVADSSVATGFSVRLTNEGDVAGTVRKINWTVNSGSTVGKESVPTTITLEKNASAVYGLIIIGLHDETATADVTIE